MSTLVFTIELLNKLNFSSTNDKINSYSENSTLYYRLISDKEFNKLLEFCNKTNFIDTENKIVVIFNTLSDKGLRYGLDAWISQYSNINDIGNKKPIAINELGNPDITNKNNYGRQFLEIILILENNEKTK